MKSQSQVANGFVVEVIWSFHDERWCCADWEWFVGGFGAAWCSLTRNLLFLRR